MGASDERFAVRRSGPGKGLGLFARVAIAKKALVLEYTGKKIPTKTADELNTRYLFEIDDEWTIDGAARTNTARYINHSCDPNCEAEIDDGRIFLYALRNIAPGEELTFDYGDDYFAEFIRPVGCRCAKCAAQSNPPASLARESGRA